jgi:hypothetical protein
VKDPKQNGGKTLEQLIHQNRQWTVPAGAFAAGLMLEPDSATHGCITPAQLVPFAQYENDLAATPSSSPETWKYGRTTHHRKITHPRFSTHRLILDAEIACFLC